MEVCGNGFLSLLAMIARRSHLPQLLERFGLAHGAEVGVASGGYSAEILAGTRTVRKLWAIDAWAGDRGHDDDQLAQARERLGRFGDRVEIVRADFATAAAGIRDGSLDFVYIDGYAHTGNDEGRNFELFWPKLREGGLMGGHDFCARFPENVKAVRAFLDRHRGEIDGTFVTRTDVFRSWFAWKGRRPASRLAEVAMFGRDHVGWSGDGKSIAVVGNGPLCRGDADRIAAADVVVRFNNWNRRADFSPETAGRRGEVLFTHGDLREAGPADGFAAPETVVLAIPAPFKIDRMRLLAETWWPESRLAMANPYLLREACIELGLDSEGWAHPMPTAGFSLLYHLWCFREGQRGGGGSVHVTGFDWHVDREEGTCERVRVGSDEVPGHYNHSYLREAMWCAAHLLDRPGWEFSESAREALAFVGNHG